MLTLVSGRPTKPRIDHERLQEPRVAGANLETLRDRVPGDVLQALRPVLHDSPDPDQSLHLFERFVAAHPEFNVLFAQDGVLLHYAVAIFGHSHWLGETLLRHPGILGSLAGENLERAFDSEEYAQRLARFRECVSDPDLSSLLARFRKREYARIALRDILGIATLGETISEISALTDTIIQGALHDAQAGSDQRYGPRPRDSSFAVLALGKLGGNELNYSSDIDLLYLYEAGESSPGVSSGEFFIRQAQFLTAILSQTTPEGPVFRIDLRLRPEGREGEPAVSLERALDYYRNAARDWEFQALIKARHVAGDARLSQSFLQGIENRVYTEHLNFAAIATALRSRQQMDARRTMPRRSGNPPPDVKLDHGGIRDIEFLVQCLQRVYGGAEPWLRSRGTLFALQKLYDKDHLEPGDFHRLSQAYDFLRRLEHRLQLRRGHQVHRLPESAAELEVLGRALGQSAEPASLLRSVQDCLDGVREIYGRVIHRERDKDSGGLGVAPSLSFSGPETSFEQAISGLAPVSPELAGVLRRAGLSRHGRDAVIRFLASLAARPDGYDLLAGNLQCVAHLLPVLDTSEYLAEILVRHPEALCLLPDLDGDPADRAADGLLHFPPPSGDLGQAMTSLRREFRTRLLINGTRDILRTRPALDSLRQNTRAAEYAIRGALRATGGEAGLAVFALGRLGTHEFDIASDADLLFVRNPDISAEQARAVAAKLVHLLAAYTREGTVFAVDARLRPHGGEGELVVTPAQLEKYLAEESQPWEGLTYSKARFVAGDDALARTVLPSMQDGIIQAARSPGFPREVLEMRTRLEKSNRYRHSFKLACGGFYDIDFLAAFLMLREGSLHEGNTLERLQHLRQAGILDRASFATLARAAVLFRTTDHVIRLVTGRAVPELPEAEHAREAAIMLVNQILQPDSAPRDLQAELEATQEHVRRAFAEIVRE